MFCAHYATFYILLLNESTTTSDFDHLKSFFNDRFYRCANSPAGEDHQLYLPDSFHEPMNCSTRAGAALPRSHPAGSGDAINSESVECGELLEALESGSLLTRRFQYVAFYERWLADMERRALCTNYTSLYLIVNAPCARAHHFPDLILLNDMQSHLGSTIFQNIIHTNLIWIDSAPNWTRHCDLSRLRVAAGHYLNVTRIDSASELGFITGAFFVAAAILIAPVYPLYKFLKHSRYRRVLFSFILRNQPIGSVFPKALDPEHVNAVDGCRAATWEDGPPDGKGDQQAARYEIALNELRIHKGLRLGEGAFAVVYRATLSPTCLAAREFAIKLIASGDDSMAGHTTEPHAEMAEGTWMDVAVKMLHSYADERAVQEMRREIGFMRGLGYSRHILNIVGAVTATQSPLLVLEYCANGSLLAYLRACSSSSPSCSDEFVTVPSSTLPTNGDDRSCCEVDKDADTSTASRKSSDSGLYLKIAWQTADALVYLSSRNYIHRDVAARNVLLTGAMDAKLADFGLCRYSAEALYTAHGGRLPIRWTAPEALKKAEFSAKSDVWSYGVLLYELFSNGAPPYADVPTAQVLNHLESGARLDQPAGCPDRIYQLMQRCWEEEPTRRPTAEWLEEKLRRPRNAMRW